jgi:hypothetical protein
MRAVPGLLSLDSRMSVDLGLEHDEEICCYDDELRGRHNI